MVSQALGQSSAPPATSSYPTVQDLSLTLSADIEFNRLWKTITEILSQHFHASRITLCLPHDSALAPSSTVDSSQEGSRWGLKAHWDFKHHFLDENTVTPKDEFAHQHHHHRRRRLNKSTRQGQESADTHNPYPQSNLHLSLPLLSGASSSSSSLSSVSSASSTSFSKKRATVLANSSLTSSRNGSPKSFTASLSAHGIHGIGNEPRLSLVDTNNTSSSNDIGSVTEAHESSNVDSNQPRDDLAIVYHEDYWNTGQTLDGGYSSSASSMSSYSSISSSVSHSSEMSVSISSSQVRSLGEVPKSGTECFANLQSLEYDPEPLLDEPTIDKILREAKTVALTREYTGSKGTEHRNSAKVISYLNSNAGHLQRHQPLDDDLFSYDTDSVEGSESNDTLESSASVTRTPKFQDSKIDPLGQEDAFSDIDSSLSSCDSEGSYFPPVESTGSEGYARSLKLSGRPRTGHKDYYQDHHPTIPEAALHTVNDKPTPSPYYQLKTKSHGSNDDENDAIDSDSQSAESDNDSSSGHSSVSGCAGGSSAWPKHISTSTPKGWSHTTSANSRSVIHVPFYRSADHNNQRHLPSDIRHQRPPVMPVGIVSFLSDQVPYPVEALSILTDLNPYLANQISNALRFEIISAGSSMRRGLSERDDDVRADETFTESIERKMKGSNHVKSTKASASNIDRYQEYVHHRQFTKDLSLSGILSENSQSVTMSGVESTRNRLSQQTILGNALETSSIRLGELDSDMIEDSFDISGGKGQVASDVTHKAFSRAGPVTTTGDVDIKVGETKSASEKRPETYFNLDSTSDEIHRSLNLLNLDISGSASCLMAPNSKRVLGRQHNGSKQIPPSLQIEDAFLSTWTSNRRRASLEGVKSSDGLWRTLGPEEEGKAEVSALSPTLKSVPIPVVGSAGSKVDISGRESPLVGSASSFPSSSLSRRHLISTHRRPSIRRRRKSMKESGTKQHAHSYHSESSLGGSPYTPNIPGFPAINTASEPAYGNPIYTANTTNSLTTFSTDASPTTSPFARHAGVFDQGTFAGRGFHGATLEVHPNRAPGEGSGHHSKEEKGSGKERVMLSRHGSGYSIHSDDTSLASPSLHSEKQSSSGGRRHRKRNNAFASERTNHNPFPRTRLLRLIIDAIPHHVFTLSPQSASLTWLNQRSLQYSGQSYSQLLHLSWTRLLHEDDRETFQPLFKDCFDRGQMFNAQYRVRRYDGQYRWFLGRILPVRDGRANIVHWFGTSTDIHDQKLAELEVTRQVELEVNEKKYRLLAEAIPQIVFTAAPQIGLTYANAKWFTYSGQVFEQTYGLGFLDHVHPEDREKCAIPTNISEGAPSPSLTSDKKSTSAGAAFGQGPREITYQTEVRLKRKDGKFRWFLVKLISVEVVEQGRKWFGTCTDINDQKQLEHKLKEAHDAAQKSTESKTRFLSNMSHEIRTPLVGITGMISFLIMTDLTSEQLDYVHTVQQSADALLLVINDILDLSKVEAGMMKLEMEPFSIHAMIEGANELLSTLAFQKGLELSFLVEDNVPEVVIGDRVRLRQVLINIIGNAIKFTSHGEVFSRCSLEPLTLDSPSDVLTIKFEISDTGKGFDEAERAVMFKPFSQVDASTTRKHGGTGLGLVLSKEFVELHGGSITCESVKGEGSKFSFTFAARIPSPDVVARATTPIMEDESHMNGLLNGHNKIGAAAAIAAGAGVLSATPVTAEVAAIDVNWSTQLASGRSSPAGDTNGSTTPIGPGRDSKRQSELSLLKHVTGLKLIPGEMCYPEPDYEDTKTMATKAFKVAFKKIERGEFVTADTAISNIDEDNDHDNSVQEEPARVPKPVKEKSDLLAPQEVSTAMTRTESILDDRRYLRAGQVTPSNPPLGEPACVAVIAANLPNPAMEMKLTIPAKVLEAKAQAAEAKKAILQSAALVGGGLTKPLATKQMPMSVMSTLVPTPPIVSPPTFMYPEESRLSNSASPIPTMSDQHSQHVPDKARILVVADMLHAREAIVHLIRQLVPKELEPLMDVAADLKEGVDFLVGGRNGNVMAGSGEKYNCVVINLSSYMAVMDLFSVLNKENIMVDSHAMTCVITTPIQRAALMEAIKVEEEIVKLTASETTRTKVAPSKVEWVFKPLTKAKLYVAFADMVTHQESLIHNNNGEGHNESNAGNSSSSGDGGNSGEARSTSTSPSSHNRVANKRSGHDGSTSGSEGGASSEGSKMKVKRPTAQQVAMTQKEVFSQMHDFLRGKDVRILLAEDDLVNQKVIRRYFQVVGVELVIANDGNECLEKFKAHPPGYFSLILCDLFMPGKDGYAATREIRQFEDETLNSGENRIPILALSANVMANVAEQCMRSGFTSYLSKPVEFRKLSEALRKYLS